MLRLGVVEDFGHWIGTRSDDNNDWRGVFGVIVEIVEVGVGRGQIVLAQLLLLLHNLLHHWNDLVRTDSAQNYRFLQQAKVVPFVRPRILFEALRVRRIVNFLPSFGILDKVVVEAGKGREFVTHFQNGEPSLV